MQQQRIFEQRFNVALSRARDRLVLVRSVTSSDLRPGDLKLQVIEHFRNPMGDSKVSARKDILDVCESGFEREFGVRLIELGYRLRAQVPVGGFRIDFVVEGADDRRLAIELDGDAWHGPDRWAEDFRRQNALERLGWTFWRCWGSSWVADRDGCLADLMRSMERMGIEPLGVETPQGMWTEFRDVGGREDVTVESSQEAKAAVAADGSVYAEPPASIKPEREAHAASVPFVAPPALNYAEEATLVVEVGDLVVVRYNDEPNRAVRVRLSRSEHKPEVGIIHVTEPLAQALLGRAMEEEIDVKIGNKTRWGVIELIERGTSLAA